MHAAATETRRRARPARAHHRISARTAFARTLAMRGQSTVEFLVLALVLLPLFLIVPLLGKHLDIAHTTTIASRYVAFEGTVRHGSSQQGWKTDAQLADEVRRRFFSASAAPLKTGDVAGDFAAHRNPLWSDHRAEPLLPVFASHIGATSRREPLSQPVGAVFAPRMGLDEDNLHTGTVRVKVADVAGLAPFDALGLSIERHTTVLADPWAAAGPADVRDALRGDGWNPAGPFPYRPLDALISWLKPFVVVLEGAQLPTAGRVDPDLVPADRIR